MFVLNRNCPESIYIYQIFTMFFFATKKFAHNFLFFFSFTSVYIFSNSASLELYICNLFVLSPV